MRMIGALLAAVAVVAAVAAGMLIASQAASGPQPWSNELSDNLIFARAMPFLLALGVAFGFLGAAFARRARQARPGEVRRFSTAVVFGHWLMIVGFLLALPTGVWQYFGGIVDVTLPVPLYLIYRVHYIGAAVLLVGGAYFLTYWWMSENRALVVPRGSWREHLHGLVHEIHPVVAGPIARLLRVPLDGRPPRSGQFTFYETAFSFPSWLFAIGLITITGIVKSLRYEVPIPGTVLFVASTLHVAAMVMLVLKVLDHLRYVFGRWPLVVAMATGWLSERYARARFPGWRREGERSEAA